MKVVVIIWVVEVEGEGVGGGGGGGAGGLQNDKVKVYWYCNNSRSSRLAQLLFLRRCKCKPTYVFTLK